MFSPRPSEFLDQGAESAPQLFVIVDTEEEFDWSKPHDRSATGVRNLAFQQAAHRIFDEFGLRPIYAVDYPVASQKDGVEPLKELLTDGRCLIGAHLHPWVTPPHREEVSSVNSYPGNLPMELEQEKLSLLGDKISEAFGVTPRLYRAGRFGAGPNTARILARLGYEIDTSVLAGSDLGADGGPDFSGLTSRPYWFSAEGRRLLEIPVTQAYLGLMRRRGPSLYPIMDSPTGRKLRLGGFASRLKMLERIRLTPEGIGAEDQIRLANALFRRGQRICSYTYHSSSLMPGGSPYAVSEVDVDAMLDHMRRFFDHFFGTMNGHAVTPFDILSAAQQASCR